MKATVDYFGKVRRTGYLAIICNAFAVFAVYSVQYQSGGHGRNRKVLPRYYGLDFSLLWLGFGYRDRTVASVALGSRLHSDLQRTSGRNRHPRNRGISAHARRGCLRLDAHTLKDCYYIAVPHSNCSGTPVAIFFSRKEVKAYFQTGL